MAQRPGGLDPFQLQEAATALARAASFEAIAKLVDTMPAFRAPKFHAELKAQYDSFRERRHPNLARMRGPYGALFLELHHRIHQRNVSAAREAGRPASRGQRPPPYAPGFFAAVRDAFAEKLPAVPGPAYFLDDGLDELREEVAAHTGGAVTLPAYEPTRGSGWCALLVGCAVCDAPRIDVRAYQVDLVDAPELEAPLRAGRINQAVCPSCGSDVFFPLRTIAIDPPGPGDDLAELTCFWRLTPQAFVYQPTPGTKRDEQNDQILQIRFEWLLENEPTAGGATRAIAYSLDELVQLLDRFTSGEDALPVPMGTMLEQLRRDVTRGIISLSAAQEVIFREVPPRAADWALLNPGAAQRAEDPVAHVLSCWMTEAVAQAQNRSPAERIYFAHQTAWSLMAMGEHGVADAALARAEDLLPQLEEGEARAQCERLLGTLRAELLEVFGKPEEAIALREKLDLSSVLAGDSWHARVARQEMLVREAGLLWQIGRHEEAFAAYQNALRELPGLLQECSESDDEAIRRYVPDLKHNLSGALANFGGLLQELLERGEVDAPEPVGAMAERTLRHALELSLEVGGMEFAGIQAHSLAALLEHLGRSLEAEEWMQRAVDYAARAGDHVRVWAGHEFLANRALAREQGAAAIEHVAVATRECIRHEVGLGYESAAIRGSEALSLAALRAIDAGGDPFRAVALVESLRAANTAASIATGTPFRSEALPNDVRELIQARERLRLQLAWRDETDLRAQLERVVQELKEARRQLALRDPRYARWVDATDQDVAEPESILRRLNQLGPNAMWLGLFEGPDTLWSYSVKEDARVAQRPLPGDRSPEALASAVLTPHADRLASLGPDDVLVVSVAGALGSVPFAALPFADGHLVERARIVTTEGFGILASALDRVPATLDSFLLVGGPKRPDLDPLPGAADEIRAIAALLEGRTMTLVGAAATVGAIKEHAAEHAALHFSCHAVADPAADRASRLMLSPDPLRDDSGVLTEERILSELEIQPGCFVNLAGCATGRVVDANTPLLGGLVPAFLIAGARSVVASLWPIADTPAACFQGDLYRTIAGGAVPAQALAVTQRRCIAGELGDDLRAPMVWAAYAAYGAG